MLESEVNSISDIQKNENFYDEKSNNSIEQCSPINIVMQSELEEDKECSTTSLFNNSLF